MGSAQRASAPRLTAIGAAGSLGSSWTSAAARPASATGRGRTLQVLQIQKDIFELLRDIFVFRARKLRYFACAPRPLFGRLLFFMRRAPTVFHLLIPAKRLEIPFYE